MTNNLVYSCLVCKARYKKYTDMNVHMMEHHTDIIEGAKPYQQLCDTCY